MPAIPATVRPDLWALADPNTITTLYDQIADLSKTTTPETTMATLVTALALTIVDTYPKDQWGPIAYDLNLHLQHTLLQELLAQPLAVVQEPSPDAPTEPGRVITMPDKFSGGVGVAPGATPIEGQD